MKTINTENAPSAIGPYSQAICTGNLLFISGQIPLNPETGMIPEGIEEQSRQVIKNIEAIAKASNTSITKTVKTTCFLVDMSCYKSFNNVYAEYFTGKPARSCVGVKALPKDVLIEIEATIKL